MAWEYFPHERARPDTEGAPLRADRPEGNHGEDVKEQYFYLDNTPTHAYMRALYKYSQAEYPYAQLVAENRRRDRRQPEFELLQTGVLDDERYFDVTVEYAKAAADDCPWSAPIASGARATDDAGRAGVPLARRGPLPVALSRRSPVHPRRCGRRLSRGIRAGGVLERAVRRYLELAGAHLASDELPDRRNFRDG